MIGDDEHGWDDDGVFNFTGIDKPLTIHQLRHTFASRALNAGVSISVVSKWMGHASISTTYNIYIHAMEQERLTALDVLEAM